MTTAYEWYSHGLVHERAGRSEEALVAFKNSLRINSHVAAPYVALARLFKANLQKRDAMQCLQRAVQCEPENAQLRTFLGRSLADLGEVEVAQRSFEQALQLAPQHLEASLGLAALYEDKGAASTAAHHYRQVLIHQPHHPQALSALLHLGKYIEIDTELSIVRDLLQDPALANETVALLAYGAGKELERRADYSAAFNYYRRANQARREAVGPFDRKAFTRRIDRLCEIFSAEFLQHRADWGAQSDEPVFIVGLPRSGTTLTEQILASHPQVYGAGEIDALADLATALPDRLGKRDTAWPGAALLASAAHLQQLGQDYLQRLRYRRPAETLRSIDKQPLNFFQLGLVALALPGARIIHCIRDPRNNGLAVFSENFSLEQRWSTDLADIAHYWHGYRRLMNHWQSVTSLKILEVQYEQVIADFEPQVRRLLDFLQLPWDAACLDFHQHARAVQTPSRWQVRQPLYKTSVDRWRNFAKELQPLIEELKI